MGAPASAAENDFVERVYERLASVYDLVYGPPLQPGRHVALKRMDLKPGDRILEVGVGTGLSAMLYPDDCSVVGVDLSTGMLARAQERIEGAGRKNIRLAPMDAQRLAFPDDSFDVVYAPYLISLVPDPVQVAREMRRVCRPGGKLLILNHFKSSNPVLALAERVVSPLTVHIGFKTDVELPPLLERAGLVPVSVEKVNVPPLWTLVTCIE
jgi:phosphatidylethanolamine/phosphatidyl-N-methylethanolamine N-methyltransferase